MSVVRSHARPRLAAVLAVVMLATVAGSPGALAGTTPAPHPAHIHTGVCPAPGEIVADLSNVAPDFPVDGTPSAASLPVGASTARPIEASVTTVDMPLADVVASDHAIVVHASAEDMATYLVCGDIGGRTLEETDLPIALDPVGESGYHGVAVLSDLGGTQTRVTVYLVMDAPAGSTGEPTGTQTVAVGSTLYFSGFDITVEEATLDPEAGSLEISAVFDNLGTGASDLTSLQLNGHPTVEWNGEVVPLRVESVRAPAGAATRASLTSTDLPDGFTLDGAVLIFGDPTQHQASVALEPGATASFESPLDITLPRNARRVVLRGVAQIRITDAQLIPAGCTGRREAVAFTPAPADELTLALTVTVRGPAPLGALINTIATAPDGTSGVGGPGVLSIRRGQTERGLLYCYTVPMPGPGRYAVRFEASDRAGTSRFTVPEPSAEE
jgi:hypothetical protein